jgi:hypothetical protein
VKFRALVLNAMAENLDALKCGGWGGIYSPTHQNGRSGGYLSMGAPDTVRCASHVTQPLGFDRWSSDRLGHRTVWCRTGQSLFTARCVFWRCSDSARAARALFTFTVHCPVNYSRVALQKPEAEQFRVDLPGAPDTVRWHTGQSGAPDQSSLRLVLLLSF